MANTSRYARDPVWWVPEDSVFSLGILVSPLTTEKLKMAHVESNLRKKKKKKTTITTRTHRK